MNRPNPDPQRPAEARYASTAQVASALGVSVTTVKRWVDDGVLPATRTHGGHRKLLVADVLQLVREGGLPGADVSRLLPAAEDRLAPEQVRDRLAAVVESGDANAVREVVLAAYRGGVTVEALADQVFAPVMMQLGHDWETGKIDVMREHRVTQACVGVLYELRAYIRQSSEPNRPVAVGGAPEGDHYAIPSLLAKLTLLEAGWEPVNIGPNTPFSALVSAVEQFAPRLVWLSVSHLTDTSAFVAQYSEFYQAMEEKGVAVAIGGRALTAAVREKMPYTSFGDRLSHLGAFARSLHRRPQRPKRGRPPVDKRKAGDDEPEEGVTEE